MHQVVKVELLLRSQLTGRILTPVHDHLFDKVEPAHGFIGNGFQFDGVATAICDIRCHHHFGLGIDNAAAQGTSTKAGVHHAMNRANAGAGQHGGNPFHGQGHIDDHAVAFAYAERFEAVGHLVDAPQQLAVRHGDFTAVLASPNQRHLVAAPGVGVSIQGVHGDIALSAEKPLEARIILLKNLVPFAKPFQLVGHTGPKPLVIRERLSVCGL